MRCERGFQVYHAVLFHHGTNGCDTGLMTVIRIRDGGHGDGGAFLKPLKLVLKDIETDFQVFGIYNAEQCLTGGGGGIEDGIELGPCCSRC